MRGLRSLSSWLWFTTIAVVSIISFADDFPIAKPGCQTKCGEVTIPYPFGIGGQEGECSLSSPYNIYCNTSTDPPKPFLLGNNKTQPEIIHISLPTGQMRIRNTLVTKCYKHGVVINSKFTSELVWIELENLPVVLSDTANKFIGIGCDDLAMMIGISTDSGHVSGCLATCTKEEDMLKKNDTSCLGKGCCQAVIEKKGMKISGIGLISSLENSTIVNSNNMTYCSAAFLAEEDTFSFGLADLLYDNAAFRNRTIDNVPVVLDWFVGVNETCAQAQQTPSRFGYACKENTNCTDIDGGSGSGYRCGCLPGYEGNPYLSPGCTDINECADRKMNPCSHGCKNTIGYYNCTCPHWLKLNGNTRCEKDLTKIIVGVSFAFLFWMIVAGLVYYFNKKRKLMKMREKFFEQNGGALLTQQLSPNGGYGEAFKVFSVDELKEATNNYSEDRILGKGGFGTVYKGILKDGREVAIKRSRVADQTQVEQFINELVILTQINHRNVVKILGCCLETEVPLLVYELVSNGTLFHHIQRNKGATSWLTWANCVRLAAEAADALSYLHSAASMPIIHRDVKSSNILLDESYTAKISDFGASRLVPIDQAQVTTLVQGTLGYLDPEYFHTSQLTEKSDVYSFGIVLAELLTKERPLSLEREMEDRSLAAYFISSVKEERLMEILDPQLVREANEEQLVTIANLVVKCLNVKGEDRPTMKGVALELEGLKKQSKHPWAEKNNEQTIELMSQRDLYPVPSIVSNVTSTTVECSGQYTMQMDMIAEMNHPR